jgi:hypothetical protein
MAEVRNEHTRGTDPARRGDEAQKPSLPRRETPTTRERNLDQTIADSFPASDPPSSDPNPEGAE